MHHDLEKGAPPDTVQCDICVIGAGPVGLSVARALADMHRSVTLVERGPVPAVQQSESRQISFDRRSYRGATVGRAFGAGGTSALWGGQLLPVREADFQARPQIGAPAWPLSYADLAPHFAALESWMRVVPGSFAQPTRGAAHPLENLRWMEWAPRFSKWTAFGRRNIYDAFGPAMAASRLVRVFVNARVEEWQFADADGRQRLSAITARSASGSAMTVRAKAYVICAGALESARCVLEMSEACGGLAAGVDRFAGRYLHDHLSVRLAQVHIKDYAGFQRLFAPVFAEKTMRSLRMELTDDFLSRDGLPALYAHFLFETPAHSSFALLRETLRSIQQGRVAAAFNYGWRIPLALPGITRILFDRFVRSRLSFPRNASVFLHCDFEQAPLRENRVYLGPGEKNGKRQLHIDWDLGCDASRIASSVRSAFTRFWLANDLESIARLEFFEYEAGAVFEPTNLYDLYHPAGTTRMSANPNEGVVNPDLLVHGTRNVYVVGSAVFPSIGAANPTFTAMALGLRAASFIDQGLAAG